MIEAIKNEILAIEGCIEYLELTDTAWTPVYIKLRKQRRILMRTLKKLQKIEEVYKNV